MFEKKKKKKIYHFTSALFSKDMLRIVKGFAPWILFDCLRKSFYIRWSAGRSPRVHEVNPGRDPSENQRANPLNVRNGSSYGDLVGLQNF